MQKSGNNSPYLLATIMDLDKEDGLREKDTVKLKNAMEVNPYLSFDIFNKSGPFSNYIIVTLHATYSISVTFRYAVHLPMIMIQ